MVSRVGNSNLTVALISLKEPFLESYRRVGRYISSNDMKSFIRFGGTDLIVLSVP